MTINARLDEIAMEALHGWRNMSLENAPSLELVVRAAIDKAIELVLTAEPSDKTCEAGLNASAICIREYYKGNYTGTARSFSNKECGEIYRAMSSALLEELKK